MSQKQNPKTNPNSKVTPDLPPEEEQQATRDLRQIFPFVRSWKQLYGFVLAELVVLIVVFYLFSRAYS